MEKSELLALAREYAKSEDLFDLLGIDALEADDEAKVRRAWRKASLKYHPDKVGGPTGDGFNETMKAKWELLERAREILSDPATREAYNSARSAILIREQQRAAMDAKKRAMIEDLEARENGTAVKRKRDDGKVAETEQEKQAAMERGRKRREERERLMREAEERERLRNPTAQEEKMTKTSSAKQPTQQPQGDSGESNPTASAPDEDSRIADLEKRLEEVRQRKAAKKARKDKDASSPTGVEEPTTTTATGEDTTTAAPKPKPKRSAKMDALLARLRAGKQGE
ncbi:pre-mRNA-splicing factor cwc23 [Apiospora marii]|uniref:pre-mRNA-splicing factor cwc23 n=1 Tax=Apiospora marii TaxID=335849 RepID=UPI0031314D96